MSAKACKNCLYYDGRYCCAPLPQWVEEESGAPWIVSPKYGVACAMFVEIKEEENEL